MQNDVLNKKSLSPYIVLSNTDSNLHDNNIIILLIYFNFNDIF